MIDILINTFLLYYWNCTFVLSIEEFSSSEAAKEVGTPPAPLLVENDLTPPIWCLDYALIQNKSGRTTEQHEGIASWLTSASVSQPGKY